MQEVYTTVSRTSSVAQTGGQFRKSLDFYARAAINLYSAKAAEGYSHFCWF